MAQIITTSFNGIGFSIGGDLSLKGGTVAGAIAQIECSTPPLYLDWKTTSGPTGAINLQANAAEALIWTTVGYVSPANDLIIIGGTTPPSSITLEGGTGATSRAMIYTNVGGSIQASVDGPYTITGGSASVDGRAGFYTGVTSSSGNITLSGEQTDPSAAGYAFQLEGGTGTGDNSAEISVERASGSIALTNSGRLLLQGGSGDDSSARIITQGAGNTGSILITGTGDVSLQGGSGGNPGAVSNAEISSLGSITSQIQNGSYLLTGGDIDASQALITAVSDVNLRGYDVTLTPGASGVVDGSNAIIESTGDGSRVFVRALNEVSLSGNATLDQKSQIQTTSATGSSPVAIYSKILTLQGGSALNSLAEITTQKGPVVLAILNHITMTGGSAMGAHAWVHNTQGPIIAGTQNLTITGGAASTNTGMETTDGNIAVICKGNCTLSTTNPLGAAFIHTLGVAPSGNLLASVAGTLFVDTAIERWGVYYPNSFYGNAGYTLFYKENGIPFVPPAGVAKALDIALLLQRAAFIDSEMFFDLKQMDNFVFYDRFDWSVLEECVDLKHGSCRGLSIRRKRNFITDPRRI
ncbi:MAG: hypothetical protein HYZ48_01950 [Chlamydiales bacterium]|nr:hypothetical protein [Chlamydiales bacterium]